MDVLTVKQRRKNMQRIKSKDTSIELKLRTALWHEGLRYRKNYAKLPGKPDIVFIKSRVAVFCDSSFWHGRDFGLKKPVATNSDFWNAKIRRNIERDKEVNQLLLNMGWCVLRFWDTEINKNMAGCVQAIKDALSGKDVANEKQD